VADETPSTAGTGSAIADAECFLFDFDGTLAPNLDLPDMRRRVVALTRERGVPDEIFERLYIVEIIETSARWLADRNPEIGESYRRAGHLLITQFEVEAARATHPFPEIRQTLGKLRAKRKRIGIVTRSCTSAVRTVFGDIDDYCDSVLARDNVAHLKPDARHLTQALQALGQPAGPAVMVGDGALDMQVGRELDMFCVGVLTGSGTTEQLREAGAQLILPRASDLLRYL